MARLRDPAKVRWLNKIALLALGCQAGAWWWAAHVSGDASLLGPTLLGLTGVIIALARPIGWYLRGNHADTFKFKYKSPELSPLAQQKKNNASAANGLQLRQTLADSLDAISIGLEVWDAQDRLMLYNPAINRMNAGIHTPEHIGQTYEALMIRHLKRHLIPCAVGNEKAWLSQHLTSRGTRTQPLLLELANDRWVNLYETRSPEGSLVVAWVDVTEIMHKDMELETANRQLTKQSTMDELTGLANRRHFDEALKNEWQRAARAGWTLSLLMVDIDHFKSYNDHYGHVAGDKCLRSVANILERCVRRAGELVARYGGEEFVILLPGADLAHAHETAQNCLALIQQESLPHAASLAANHVTISIGVASVLPDPTRDPFTLVNAADAAMYRAKSTGRAHYEVADQADWDIDPDTPRTRPGVLA